ncbi:hypothetical protein GCM10008020_06240 [Massilia psychrophila]|nr:hypothetical protein GCM10008020_06240 [Massilia psychrophila]
MIRIAPAAVKVGPAHGLPQVVDARRALPDQERRHRPHRRLDGAGTGFDDRFAPAEDAFVGLDFQQHPAGRHAVGGELGDFHSSFVYLGRGDMKTLARCKGKKIYGMLPVLYDDVIGHSGLEGG